MRGRTWCFAEWNRLFQCESAGLNRCNQLCGCRGNNSAGAKAAEVHLSLSPRRAAIRRKLSPPIKRQQFSAGAQEADHLHGTKETAPLREDQGPQRGRRRGPAAGSRAQRWRPGRVSVTVGAPASALLTGSTRAPAHTVTHPMDACPAGGGPGVLQAGSRFSRSHTGVLEPSPVQVRWEGRFLSGPPGWCWEN